MFRIELGRVKSFWDKNRVAAASIPAALGTPGLRSMHSEKARTASPIGISTPFMATAKQPAFSPHSRRWRG